MRTTLDLNDDLLAEAKALAARERLTLTRLIEEGLTPRLRQSCHPAPAVVDSRSNPSLWDAADGLMPA